MVFGRTLTLAPRFHKMARIRAAAAPTATAQADSLLRRLRPEPLEEEPGIVDRRVLQRRPLFQAAAPRMPRPRDQVLRETILGLDKAKIVNLLPSPAATERMGVSVEELRKVMRASQMEKARSRLRGLPGSCVSFPEFLQICCEVSSAEEGPAIARSLDKSGAVVVIGDAVLLRPEEVAKLLESMIHLSVKPDPQAERMKVELREMEEKKAMIDSKAKALVKRELWGGLGFFVVQTAGFMRLTFWEMSWDVMEPICYFFTSIYFMAGYAFFLRTSKEPSFEGYFQSRFKTKQKKLMKACNFDLNRFNELKRGCSFPWMEERIKNSDHCHCTRRDASVEDDKLS